MEAQQQIAILPEPGELGALVVNRAKQFAVRHKYLTGSYLTGLIFMLSLWTGLWAGNPLSHHQQATYNKIMNSIDLQAEFDATQDYWMARQAYYATKGWFWSCDGLCQRNKQRMQRAEETLTAIRREGQARMVQAKRTAGLTSTYAVEEMQDSFWQYFKSAKDFAKRQSFWDIMWMSMRSMSRGRDETWLEFGLKVLMNVLLNLSMGLCLALVFFVVGLWNIVRQYANNPITAALIFCAAACTAFSFVVTYLLAVYGAAATTVYGVLKVAETSARQQRLQGGGGGQRHIYNGRVYNDGRRPHHD